MLCGLESQSRRQQIASWVGMGPSCFCRLWTLEISPRSLQFKVSYSHVKQAFHSWKKKATTRDPEIVSLLGYHPRPRALSVQSGKEKMRPGDEVAWLSVANTPLRHVGSTPDAFFNLTEKQWLNDFKLITDIIDCHNALNTYMIFLKWLFRPPLRIFRLNSIHGATFIVIVIPDHPFLNLLREISVSILRHTAVCMWKCS